MRALAAVEYHVGAVTGDIFGQSQQKLFDFVIGQQHGFSDVASLYADAFQVLPLLASMDIYGTTEDIY